MVQLKLPACFYPTTVVLIDDNHNYLISLRSILDKQRATYKLFDKPDRALKYLTEDYQPDLFTKRSIEHPEETDWEQRQINVNVLNIHHEIYNPHRFEQVSVIVIDQEMPGVKGLDICRKLRAKHSPIKILMLTGEVDDKKAIQAFNDNIIDKFITKNIDNFQEVLNTAIDELKQAYFNDLSAIIVDSLTQNPEHPPLACLEDKAFIEFFDDFCQQHQLIEFYLADQYGSFLMLDSDAKPSWLALKTATDCNDYTEFVELSEGVPKEIIAALSNHQQLPFFFKEEDYDTPPREWQPYMHPVTATVEGDATYHLAYIKSPCIYKIDGTKIKTFNQYVDELVKASSH